MSIKILDRICLVAIIVIVALSGFWVVKSNMRERLDVQERNNLLTKRQDNLTLADANLQELNRIIAEKKADLASLNAMIPEVAEIGQFLKHLDGLIKARDITLVTLQPSGAVAKELYEQIPIQMSLVGLFVNSYQLLQDFEGMDRLINIEKMTITNTGRDGTCRIDLTAVVFER